jgi:hypothetical protein
MWILVQLSSYCAIICQFFFYKVQYLVLDFMRDCFLVERLEELNLAIFKVKFNIGLLLRSFKLCWLLSKSIRIGICAVNKLMSVFEVPNASKE